MADLAAGFGGAPTRYADGRISSPGDRAAPSIADSQATDGYGRMEPGLSASMSGRLHDAGGAAARDAAARASQAALLGPKRPRPHKIWKKKFIKVLVVGDSGLGKTTLVKTLLSTPGERLQVHDGTFTPTAQFVKDPDSLCSTVTWKDEEDRAIWVYRIQDTPGFGDTMNMMDHVQLIRNYINSQNTKWLRMESATDRGIDLSEVEDPRVDVCLFCLPPHRMRQVDLRYMYELGRSVPVVPVITKADTMTIREAQNYKQEVFNRLQNPNLPGVRGKINTFAFDKETLDRAGMGEAAGTQAPPFLVIASNDINEDMGSSEVPVFWPERRYPWGTAEAFNPEHSDLLFLRALLLKEALEDIAKDKRARYEHWRKRELSGPKLGRRLRGFMLSTIVPVAATVWFAQNGFDVQRSRDQLAAAARRVRPGRAARRVEPPAQAPPPPPPPPVVEVKVQPPAQRKGWW